MYIFQQRNLVKFIRVAQSWSRFNRTKKNYTNANFLGGTFFFFFFRMCYYPEADFRLYLEFIGSKRAPFDSCAFNYLPAFKLWTEIINFPVKLIMFHFQLSNWLIIDMQLRSEFSRTIQGFFRTGFLAYWRKLLFFPNRWLGDFLIALLLVLLARWHLWFEQK